MIRFASAFLTVALLMGAASQNSVVADELPINTLPIADLTAEATGGVEYIEKALSKVDADADYKKVYKKVKRAGALLACVSQAIINHPDGAKAEFATADLRDAGLALKNAKEAPAARAGLEAAKKALAGEASGKAVNEHPWKGLVGMHDMMEVINGRYGKLRRSVKRIKKPEEDKLHAVALAVLSVAMEADTHEVKNDAEIPDWIKMSKDSQKISVQIVEAIREQDRKKAGALFKTLGASCKACHTKFRHEDE